MQFNEVFTKERYEDHQRWLYTHCKEGKQLDLSSADLTGADLSGADLRVVIFE